MSGIGLKGRIKLTKVLLAHLRPKSLPISPARHLLATHGLGSAMDIHLLSFLQLHSVAFMCIDFWRFRTRYAISSNVEHNQAVLQRQRISPLPTANASPRDRAAI